MPVKITGLLPSPLDGMVRRVLLEALDLRQEEFVVRLSRPHADVIVEIQRPFERRLKFNSPVETDVARELYTAITAIADEEFGPIRK
ncbi:MAG TPA: hypothetical protein VI455_13670 [Terriglobia bacterium]